MELVDAAGSKIIRQTNPKTFKANTRSGVNVVWDDATISIDDKPLTWYDDYAKNGFSDMGANSVYVKGAKIRGVGIENVKVIGVRLRKLTDDGQETGDENIKYYPNSDLSSLSSDENGTLSFDSQLDNIPSGNYYVRPYAIIINSDGAEQEIISTVHTAIVTSIPTITSHTIRSSYNNNGAVAKNNDLDGDKIYATVSMGDTFTDEKLIEKVTLHYAGSEKSGETGKELSFSTDPLTWQLYNNCYIKVQLKNGYSISTPEYDINVTGIPYNINFDSTSPAGWEVNNLKKNPGIYLSATTGYCLSPRFYVPQDLKVSVSVPVYAYAASLNPSRYKPSVYVSASNTAVASGNATNLTGGNSTSPSQSSFTNINPILDFTNTVNRVCIYANGKGINLVATNGVMLNYCKIEYAK